MRNMPKRYYSFQNFDNTKHVRAAIREKPISHKHAREISLQKAATEILKLLDNLESNAEYKGMDLDRLKIINTTVHKGRLLKRFIPRAMGRSSAKNNALIHVEIVAQEK